MIELKPPAIIPPPLPPATFPLIVELFITIVGSPPAALSTNTPPPVPPLNYSYLIADSWIIYCQRTRIERKTNSSVNNSATTLNCRIVWNIDCWRLKFRVRCWCLRQHFPAWLETIVEFVIVLFRYLVQLSGTVSVDAWAKLLEMVVFVIVIMFR